MAQKAAHIWRYGNIDVIYEPAVDGGGMSMTPPLIDFIQKRFGPDRHFGTMFEWCAGPSFIGFGLLAEGVCDSLCLADINPDAIECVEKTIEANKLRDRVRAYVSDNLESVPKHERFDLVVGNPPSFCAVNPAHPSYSNIKGDIRGNDPDWKIHRGFYSQIAPFLNLNALVLVLEVALYDREVFIPGSDVPFDIRPEEPEHVFADMIRKGGLTHIENAAFDPGCQAAGARAPFTFRVQISEKLS